MLQPRRHCRHQSVLRSRAGQDVLERQPAQQARVLVRDILRHEQQRTAVLQFGCVQKHRFDERLVGEAQPVVLGGILIDAR